MNRELRVEDYGLGGNHLEAYYHEREWYRAMAVDTDEPERRRMWELVAHGLESVPTTTRKIAGRCHPPGGFYFFAPVSPHDDCVSARQADPLAVRAVFEVLEEMEPSWISAVEDARRFADSPEVISAYTGVPVEATLAALGDWRTRL